jgi:hypothetical protein
LTTSMTLDSHSADIISAKMTADEVTLMATYANCP